MLGSPKRRIALSSLVVLLLLACALAITIWRYESALDQSRRSLGAQSEAFRAEQAVSHFWREREAINEYLLVRERDLAAHVTSQHRNYIQEIESARTGVVEALAALGGRPQETHLVGLARSGNEAFISIFRRSRGVLTYGHGIGALVANLNAGEEGVVGPLGLLQSFDANEVRAYDAAAAEASHEALVAAIIAGTLGLGAIFVFALYAFRFVGRLDRSQQRLELVLDTMSDGLVAADANGNFLIFNKAAESIMGKGPENVGTPGWQSHYGMFLPDGVTPAPEEALPLVRAMEGETVKRMELVIRNEQRPEGSSIEVSATPLQANGRRAGGVAIFRDITERNRTQVELARQAEVERASQAKSEFLSRMSHELRTPLNAVLGFGQLLETGELDARQRRNVAQILKGGRHLLELINEVLDISRIEAGNMTISLEPVHVGRALADVLDLVSPLAAEQGISIERPSPDDADRYVMADNQRLKQVLLNLLSNAIKYNREQGSVTVSLRDVAPHDLFVLVTDTGKGIAETELAKVFEPFERLGAEQSSIEGTGLGLALSKLLVEAMGGTLAVESELWIGSTFLVKLARAEAPSAAAGLPAGNDASANGSPGAARTILYVEDNPSNLELVEQILCGRPELRLLAAMQGSLGLELARRHRPDLILLDLHLPDMEGGQVLDLLRADPATREIPVVVVSADATAGQIGRLIEAGARDYLTKPLDVGRFLEVIEEALSERVGS
jgi:PAS domain S-box-containing protein